MALSNWVFKVNVPDVIEMAKENAEFKRGIGDLLLTLVYRNNSEQHVAMKNKNEILSYVIDEVYELIRENKDLTRENRELIRENRELRKAQNKA